MTKHEFLELQKKHNYKNKYKVKNKDDLEELVNLAARLNPKMDLNWLDVRNIKDMSFLFEDSKFNGDISKWNVRNVTDMESMFAMSSFNGDISKWNVSNVKLMRNMFQGAKFNGDISEWDVRNVTDMTKMFNESKFNGDISDWSIKNVRWADDFNSNLGIFNRKDLSDYISFLKSLHKNEPITVTIKREYLKTQNAPILLANYMHNDAYAKKILDVLCSKK